MIVSFTRDNREQLNKQQKEFLVRLVPLARKIQEWTFYKASFLNIPCPRGVITSLTIGEILFYSDWGSHPISKAEYINKYSNNLSLVETNIQWRGKTHLYDGKVYKAYKDWQDYSINLSDEYCFSRSYDDMLKVSDVEQQTRLLALHRQQPRKFCKNVLSTIEKFNLSEFNC